MIVLKIVTTKPNNEIPFFKDIDVINYVLDEYIFPQKLVAVTKFSDDGLTSTTTLKFPSKIEFTEFTSDKIISDFGKRKKVYNDTNAIKVLSTIHND
jgi:hypothetical protein